MSKIYYLQWTTIILVLSSVVNCQQHTSIQIPTSTPTTTTDSLDNPSSVADSSSSLSTSCGLNGNTETICSPKAGETWKNGTWYPITWNTLYPSYVASSTLDIYIYFVQNYQNVLVKRLSDISTSKGSIPVLVDDTWRLSPTAQTYESVIYIVPSDVNAEKEIVNRYSDYPPPIHNLVQQMALPPLMTSVSALPNATSSAVMSSTATVHTSSSLPTLSISSSITTPLPSIHSDSAEQQARSDAHIIQPWVIAAVVLACLAVLGACLAIFWVMRQSRRRKLVYGEKGHLELNSTASSSMFPVPYGGSSKEKFCTVDTTVSSPATLTNPAPVRFYGSGHTERGSLTVPSSPLSRDGQQFASGFISTPTLPIDEKVYMLGEGARPQSATSFSNISSRSEPPLTSTDALLIADTFRQRMRRPEWQQLQQQKKQKEEPEEEQEEDKRRQLSEQLLKTELEAEGTLMKKVGKRAHLLASTYQQER